MWLSESPPLVYTLFNRLLSPSKWHFSADYVKTKHDVPMY